MSEKILIGMFVLLGLSGAGATIIEAWQAHPPKEEPQSNKDIEK